MILDLLMKYLIAGSLFGMFLFSVITIVLPIVLRAHNKITEATTEYTTVRTMALCIKRPLRWKVSQRPFQHNACHIMRTVIRTDENRRPVITRIAVTHQFHQLATSMHGRLTPCVVRLDSCPLKAAWQEARCAVSCCSVISPWLRRSGSCIT